MKGKQLLLSIYLLACIFLAPKSNAVGEIVFDPTAFGKQVVQLSTEIVTKGASLATAAQTYVTANKILLEPLANTMIATALLAQQKGTLNLVMGGLNGQPLLQANPEKWIQDQGLNAVRVSLGDISNSKGTYSNSILSSLVNTYRGSTDLKTQIQSNSASSRPSLVQQDVCKDSALTAAATNDVQITTGSSNADAIKARKAELYNSLCKGNPQTDTALANRLLQVEQKRPDLVSTKSFEAYLAGDNAYARSIQTSLLVAKDKATKEMTAQEDIARGGGIVSPSNCTETVGTADNADLGNIANLPCRIREFTGSSAQINSAYQQALNAPIQKLIASSGDSGIQIISSLQTLLSAKNTFDLMKNAFSFTNTQSGQNSSVTSSSAVKTPDLAGDTTTRDSLTKPINARLSKYETSISKLEQNDALLISHINVSDSYLESLRSCYQGLVDRYGVSPSDPRIAPGFAYYTAHSLDTASLRGKISQDQTAIQAARGAIADLRGLLQTSNSSEEINAAYNDFESKSMDGTYPNETEAFMREGDLQTIKSDNDLNAMGDSELTQLKTTCSQLSTQLQIEKDQKEAQTTNTY